MPFQKIQEFDSGAAVYEVGDGVQFGITHEGVVYWVTPGGWDWVIDPHNDLVQTVIYQDDTAYIIAAASLGG